MILSIKNGGYAFLIRLDLMFSMSLWKEFQLLQILNELSIRLKMGFIAMSVVSWSGILVKRLVTSSETKHFLERFAFLIWETKEKVSLQE